MPLNSSSRDEDLADKRRCIWESNENAGLAKPTSQCHSINQGESRTGFTPRMTGREDTLVSGEPFPENGASKLTSSLVISKGGNAY